MAAGGWASRTTRSRPAAQLLGFETAGTAPVQVRILRQESIEVAEAAMRGETGQVMLAQAPRSTPPEPVVMRSPPTQIAMAGPASLHAAEVIAAPLPAAASPPAAAPALEPAPSFQPAVAVTQRSYSPAPPYRPAVVATPQRAWPSLLSSAHAEPLRLPPPKPMLPA